ncbi:unnamed protein product [Linum trigynum]
MWPPHSSRDSLKITTSMLGNLTWRRSRHGGANWWFLVTGKGYGDGKSQLYSLSNRCSRLVSQILELHTTAEAIICVFCTSRESIWESFPPRGEGAELR